MDFTLSEEQVAVAELAGQIVRDKTTPERLAGLGDDWFDQQTWSALAESGLLGVALPTEAGGSGLGFLGAHLVLEQIGASAAPLPFWETIVLGALPLAVFGSSEQRERYLPGVLDGSKLLTAALSEDAPGDVTSPQATARRLQNGWELVGGKASVPIGQIAEAFLVPAATDAGATGVWIVDRGAPGVQVRPQAVITGAPYAEVVLDQVQVPDGALLSGLGPEVVRWLALHGAAGLASLLAGVCDAALRLSADYTSRREQFGRPVATFQAVAQRVADAYIDVEAVQLTSVQAAWRLTEGLPADEEVAIAKWWATEAAHRVLHAAHHVHGGVGVDREYPLHRYFAMAKQHEFLLGGGTTHLLRLGALLAAEPA